MQELFQSSVYFGALISIVTYFLGVRLKKRLKTAVINPLLVAVVLTIVVLLVLNIDYDTYNSSAKYISFFLTPVTVCLAVPLYEQFEVLKKNALAVVLGIFSGVVTSALVIFLLSLLFRLDHAMYVTLLPKSITTAIGMGVSDELGGYSSLTVAAIVITGIEGNLVASLTCRVFRIVDPVARGIGIGTASHAIGTTRAMEIGPVEGAMSGLSIVVAGLLTVVLCPFFAKLI